MNDIVTPTVTRKAPVRWSQTEVDYLTTNAAKGAKALAAELGRPEVDIRAKATRLGISLRMPGSTRGRKSRNQIVSDQI